MSDLWAQIGRTWDLFKPPMRPHADVVGVLRRELDTDAADLALLGVTPEFARLGRSLVAVDANPHMIGALWIGDNASRKAVAGKQHLRDVLTDNPQVTALLDAGKIASLFEPMAYQGVSQTLIDRLLASLDESCGD